MGINEIGVLDADGVLRYNAVVHQMEGADHSEMKYFRQTKEMTPADTFTIAMVAHPAEVYDISFSGTFSGIVFCTLELDHFIKTLIAPLKFSKEGHAFLIDNQYKVLWMPDKSFFGKSFYEEASKFPTFQNLLEKMVSGESGTGEFFFYSFDNADNMEVAAQTNEFKTSHHRLLTVLDSLDAAVFVADIETCEILFVNQNSQ